jgi:hypothetical protein
LHQCGCYVVRLVYTLRLDTVLSWRLIRMSKNDAKKKPGTTDVSAVKSPRRHVMWIDHDAYVVFTEYCKRESRLLHKYASVILFREATDGKHSENDGSDDDRRSID